MWNNSYRMPTECWQKTSDFPQGKKLPTYLGRAKDKRKKIQKNVKTFRCVGNMYHTRKWPNVGGIPGKMGIAENSPKMTRDIKLHSQEVLQTAKTNTKEKYIFAHSEKHLKTT